MPSRLLREGILDSEAVNSLSAEAEVFYRRLMSVVDDFGRFDGRVSVLRSRLYPLQLEKVREANLERWIAECVKARLVRLYSHNGKQYITFFKLGPARARESKFPPPPDEHPFTDENICKRMQTDENECEHPFSSVPGSGSGSGSYSNLPSPDKPAKEKIAPRGRERNPIFDALAEVTGVDASIRSQAKTLGVKSAELAAAEPPYSPEEIFEFGRRFLDLCSWARKDGRERPTPGELVKWIHLVRAKSPAPKVKSTFDPFQNAPEKSA